MQRAVKWTIFLSATGIVVDFCLLILGPFLNIIAWSSVLAIAFHPVHQRIVRKTGRLILSAFISSVAYPTVVPKSAPTPAVASMAKAPQKATRIAPRHADPPPTWVASAPRAARQISDAPDTTGTTHGRGAA